MTVATAQWSEDQLVASICTESLYEFLVEFWGELIMETPVWNWHLRFLCDEIQAVYERVFRGEPKEYDLIINIPPGTTKSTICSVVAPAWAWTRMASFRFIGASHTHLLALDHARKARDLIEGDKYQRLFPGVKIREDQNTKGHYENTRRGMRYSIGVGGSVIGMHGHILNVDDPIDPTTATARSQEDMKAINRWTGETLYARKVDKAITALILVMQRLSQLDPSGYLLARRKQGMRVRHICLPGELDPEVISKGIVQPPEITRYYVDGLLDPVRMPKAVLADMRIDLGEYGYSGQVRQYPVPLGGGMFKMDRVVLEDAPHPGRLVRTMRYWDKAGTLAGGAYTVGVKLGMEIHQTTKLPIWWILDVIRVQLDSDRRERLIVDTARMDGKHVYIGIEQEPGSGGKESAEATARRLVGYKVRIDKPSASDGSKELRADPWSTPINAGGVKVAAHNHDYPHWWEAYKEEHEFFPRGAYKDQVDASAGAYNWLAKPKISVGAL